MLTHKESRFFDSKEIVLSRMGLFSLVIGGFQREFTELQSTFLNRSIEAD